MDQDRRTIWELFSRQTLPFSSRTGRFRAIKSYWLANPVGEEGGGGEPVRKSKGVPYVARYVRPCVWPGRQ